MDCGSILKYAERLVPSLLKALKVLQDTEVPKAKALFALFHFCQRLDYDDMGDLLESLVKGLLEEVSIQQKAGSMLWAYRALGAVVTGAEDLIDPYFDDIMGVLQDRFNQSGSSDHIKGQVFETISQLANSSGL